MSSIDLQKRSGKKTMTNTLSEEAFSEDSLLEALSFLKKHEEFSLFLLGNFAEHGYKLTAAPNSGNFRLIRCRGKITAVFCLTRRGNLLVQAETYEDPLLELILIICQKENLPILGLLGKWDFCQRLWDFFKKKGVILKEGFISREILYTVDLSKQKCSKNTNVRLLTEEDYSHWGPLRTDYLQEEGLPNDLSEKQQYELFLEKVRAKISWGYFFEEKLVSIADLNAKAFDLGQVGGVYTVPSFRKKGFAKAVIQKIMEDTKDIHKMRKLIIFTGETNTKARALYESLHVHPVGHYALLFGSNHE